MRRTYCQCHGKILASHRLLYVGVIFEAGLDVLDPLCSVMQLPLIS